MQFEDVRQLRIAARSALESSFVDPHHHDAEAAPAVTLGIGPRPGREDGADDFWLTARIRTAVREPQEEEKIRATLRKLVGEDFDLRYTGPVFALRPLGFAERKAAPSKLTIGSPSAISTPSAGRLVFSRAPAAT